MFRNRNNLIDESALVRLTSPEHESLDASAERTQRMYLLQNQIEGSVIYTQFADGRYEPCNVGKLWANFQKRCSRDLFYLIITHILQTGRYRGYKDKTGISIECLSPTLDEPPFIPPSQELYDDILDHNKPLEPEKSEKYASDFSNLTQVEIPRLFLEQIDRENPSANHDELVKKARDQWNLLDKSLQENFLRNQYGFSPEFAQSAPKPADQSRARLMLSAWILFYEEHRPTFLEQRSEVEIGKEIGLRWQELPAEMKSAYLNAALRAPVNSHRRSCQWQGGCSAQGPEVRRVRVNGQRYALCETHRNLAKSAPHDALPIDLPNPPFVLDMYQLKPNLPTQDET